LEFKVSLKELNTFGVEAKAYGLSRIKAESDLIEVFKFLRAEKLRHITLGGGSNVLFIGNFPGWILKNEILGKEVVSENEEFVELAVGSGENWHEFVLWCLEKGFYGLENLSLIPGSVGAAPIQNIGAYGVEVKELITNVEGYDLQGKRCSFDNRECQFGYRESVFKLKMLDQFFITRVTFRLYKQSQLRLEYGPVQRELEKLGLENHTPKDVSKVVIQIRQSKLPDPKEVGNAGSFFKNPVIEKNLFLDLVEHYPEIPHYPTEDDERVKVPAGWLIEKAGWKGRRMGDAGVHENQALVLVNLNRVSGTQIRELSEKIQQDILIKFGISLMPEVRMV
jgi:UDP-N-acetylmuramate dehydrogenase